MSFTNLQLEHVASHGSHAFYLVDVPEKGKPVRLAGFVHTKRKEAEVQAKAQLARAQAIQCLYRFGSHAALGRKEVEMIAKPFGVKVRMWKEKVNVHLKDLLIEGVKPGTVVERMGAWGMATAIAGQCGIDYPTAMGRGTLFHNAMAAIVKHFELPVSREES